MDKKKKQPGKGKGYLYSLLGWYYNAKSKRYQKQSKKYKKLAAEYSLKGLGLRGYIIIEL